MTSSEEELIRRAQQGDQEAFCLLAQRYERRLLALALYYLRDAHDAEDLSQEVWLKAYRAIGSFRGESGFYTWLRRIAINTFLNERRAAKGTGMSGNDANARVEMLSLEDACELPDNAAVDAEQVAERRQLVGAVSRALAALTPRERLIFLLRHREEMSGEEIAAVCKVSTGTVKKSLFRAVHKIRDRLRLGAPKPQAGKEEAGGIRPVVSKKVHGEGV